MATTFGLPAGVCMGYHYISRGQNELSVPTHLSRLKTCRLETRTGYVCFRSKLTQTTDYTVTKRRKNCNKEIATELYTVQKKPLSTR